MIKLYGDMSFSHIAQVYIIIYGILFSKLK